MSKLVLLHVIYYICNLNTDNMNITGYKDKHEWEGSTVYLMDCMDFLNQVPDKAFDLAVVDPPYGAADAINPISSLTKYKAKRGRYKEFDNIAPNDIFFDLLFDSSKKWMVWGGNYFGIAGGVIAWQKNGTAFGEGEVAICNTHKSVRFFEYTWNGMLQQNMKDKELRIHPTQKPIALYSWIYYNYLPAGGSVLDTHLGSASSRIAAHKAGNIEFIGIEIDEDYFYDGVKRFEQYARQLTLFQATI
jgi:site-specific DNA-methyltransferase (adenine-specific)